MDDVSVELDTEAEEAVGALVRCEWDWESGGGSDDGRMGVAASFMGIAEEKKPE